jgi:trimethylamine--corrinoid protein Co-methyltransferase
MAQVRYSVAGGLTAEQLDRLHESALQVIERTGVELGVPELRERISGMPGVRLDGTRVHIAPELIAEHVPTGLADQTDTDPGDEFSIDILTGFAFQDLDIATGRLRPMTAEACVRTARLVDALHDRGVRGGTPGLPQDVPPALREIAAYRIGCENSRTAAHVGVTSDRGAEIIYEMSQVMGMPFGLPVFVLSPLRIEGQSIEMALRFMDEGRDVDAMVTGMPLLGVTAPLALPGAFVEHIATVLTAYVLFRLIGHGGRLSFHFSVYPFDMKYGTIAYGTPRHILADLLGAQINRYYGVSARTCKAFHTNACAPDAHSMMQRAAFATAAALRGARNFTFGGMLGIDKIFSAEQLLIDLEIVGYVRHLVRGFAFEEDAFGVAALDDVGPGGDFLMHESTLAGFRDLWVSDLFDNRSPEQREQSPGPRIRERIAERVEALIASHSFALDPAVQRELDRLYESARRELA